jgi:hypothetical protein
MAAARISYADMGVVTGESLKMAVFWVVAPCRLIRVYLSTGSYNPEDGHMHTDRRENLKSYW